MLDLKFLHLHSAIGGRMLPAEEVMTGSRWKGDGNCWPESWPTGNQPFNCLGKAEMVEWDMHRRMYMVCSLVAC